jgi:hypothetical protein
MDQLLGLFKREAERPMLQYRLGNHLPDEYHIPEDLNLCQRYRENLDYNLPDVT